MGRVAVEIHLSGSPRVVGVQRLIKKARAADSLRSVQRRESDGFAILVDRSIEIMRAAPYRGFFATFDVALDVTGGRWMWMVGRVGIEPTTN